jgi:hypothetical protein
MMSYQVKISCISFIFTKLLVIILSRMFLVCVIEMFVYVLVISRDANLVSVFRGVSFRLNYVDSVLDVEYKSEGEITRSHSWFLNIHLTPI